MFFSQQIFTDIMIWIFYILNVKLISQNHFENLIHWVSYDSKIVNNVGTLFHNSRLCTVNNCFFSNNKSNNFCWPKFNKLNNLNFLFILNQF